jgi:hypothetical protein
MDRESKDDISPMLATNKPERCAIAWILAGLGGLARAPAQFDG